jgi:hypothetical protein
LLAVVVVVLMLRKAEQVGLGLAEQVGMQIVQEPMELITQVLVVVALVGEVHQTYVLAETDQRDLL